MFEIFFVFATCSTTGITSLCERLHVFLLELSEFSKLQEVLSVVELFVFVPTFKLLSAGCIFSSVCGSAFVISEPFRFLVNKCPEERGTFNPLTCDSSSEEEVDEKEEEEKEKSCRTLSEFRGRLVVLESLLESLFETSCDCDLDCDLADSSSIPTESVKSESINRLDVVDTLGFKSEA